jgi:hypothetical protein
LVLPFATQIKYEPGTQIRDRSLEEEEVTFCVQGAISPLLSNLMLDDLDKGTDPPQSPLLPLR